MSAATAVLLWRLIPRPSGPTPECSPVSGPGMAAVEHLRQSLAAETNARLRAERELAEARHAAAAAEEVARGRSAFLAAASHDLRQPVQALRLFLEVLAARLDGDNRQVVEGALQALQAGEGLLDALLDLTTLQAGNVVAKPRRFPLNDVLEQIGTEWGPLAAAKGVRLRVVRSTAEVVSDSVLLQRLLRNLVANAVRYTPAGGVLVGCRRAGGRLRLEVWDSGVGIPKDALATIFDEFTQLANPDHDHAKGCGLGLAIVQRLSHLLGAEVTVRSVLGKGSVFRLHLLQADAAGEPG